MPYLLTSLLTKAAAAVIEALVIRLLVQLWNAYGRSGHQTPAAA
ncbi:hypothetical protein [Streptomyces sp. NTH33]|nr:hypothetical protein [Streptomyces sp. NTH33]